MAIISAASGTCAGGFRSRPRDLRHDAGVHRRPRPLARVQFALQALHDPRQHLHIGIGAVRVGSRRSESFWQVSPTLCSFSQREQRTSQWQRIQHQKAWWQLQAKPLAGGLNERPIIARAIMRDQRQIADVAKNARKASMADGASRTSLSESVSIHDVGRDRNAGTHKGRPGWFLGNAINPAIGGNLDNFRGRRVGIRANGFQVEDDIAPLSQPRSKSSIAVRHPHSNRFIHWKQHGPGNCPRAQTPAPIAPLHKPLRPPPQHLDNLSGWRCLLAGAAQSCAPAPPSSARPPSAVKYLPPSNYILFNAHICPFEISLTVSALFLMCEMITFVLGNHSSDL